MKRGKARSYEKPSDDDAQGISNRRHLLRGMGRCRPLERSRARWARARWGDDTASESQPPRRGTIELEIALMPKRSERHRELVP